MPFTYIGDRSTNLDKVRSEIGDITSGAGVEPDGTNMPDALLNALITEEGSWGRASARACELLAGHWSRVPDSASTGQRSRSNQQVAHFRQRGKELRAQYGGGSGSITVGVVGLDFQEKDNTDID
jgi:hypothetical protein